MTCSLYSRIVAGGVLAAVATAAPRVAVAQDGATQQYAMAPRSVRYDAAIVAARAMLRDSLVRSGMPGLSVAVAVDGMIVWSEGFGWADVENRVPVEPAVTRFRVASVSKSLTSAALGQLIEAGKLDLDAPVQRYVPSFPRKPWPITTRELAGHLAGIRHYQGAETFSQRHYATVTDGLAIFEADSLLFQPNTRFSYSSYGWDLIGAVVEGASGEQFVEYMERHVFQPLGLRSIVAEYADSIIDGRARFYEKGTDGRVLNAPYVDNSYKWAGGGFLATSEDLARYGVAMSAPGFLKAATLKLLFTSQRTTDGVETGYGMGWFTTRHLGGPGGPSCVGHSGGAVGGVSYLLLCPTEHVVVAIIGNGESSFVGSGTTAEALGGLFARQ